MKWTILMVVLVVGALGEDPAQPTEPPAATDPPSNDEPVCTAVTPGTETPPTLHDTFHTYAELKVTTGTVITYSEVEIYFDFPNNQGSIIKTKEQITTRKIFDFSSKYIFTATETCSMAALPDEDPQYSFFDFTIDLSPADPPVYSAASVFYFGGTVDEQFVETTDQLDHWTSCLTTTDDPPVTVKLDYYFRGNVPVKAVVTQKAADDSDTTSEYTFFGYHEGRPCDSSVFEVPRGVVCNVAEGITPPVAPSLPGRFSLTTEVTYPMKKLSYVVKEFHDNDMQLSRYDWNPLEAMTTTSQYPTKAITIIHNFDEMSLLEYIIDYTGSCQVRPIRSEILEGEWNDVVEDENGTLIMRRGSDFFDMTPASLQYQGSKKLRDLDTDVWAEISGSKTLEFHFTKADWQTVSTGGEQTQRQPLVGIWIRESTEDATTDIMSHVVNYIDYGTQQPSYLPFDISACISDQKHFRVQVKGNFVNLAYADRRVYLDPVVRKTMARQAVVSPLRITAIEYYTSGEDTVDIWMTLLGVPTLEDGDPPVVMTELDAAFEHIQKSVESRIVFQVPYPDSDDPLSIEVIQDSLKTSAEVDDPRGGTVIKQGHSDSSMAALGIFMILLGAVVGLGVGFVLWRRRGRGIPYSVQH